MTDMARCQYCSGQVPDAMISHHEEHCSSNPNREEFGSRYDEETS
jgi:hypothetical protein